MSHIETDTTLPAPLPTENFRLTATTTAGDRVTIILCGARSSFDAAKTLGSVGKPQNVMALLQEIDRPRLEREMGVRFDDDDEDWDVE